MGSLAHIDWADAAEANRQAYLRQQQMNAQANQPASEPDYDDAEFEERPDFLSLPSPNTES